MSKPFMESNKSPSDLEKVSIHKFANYTIQVLIEAFNTTH